MPTALEQLRQGIGGVKPTSALDLLRQGVTEIPSLQPKDIFGTQTTTPIIAPQKEGPGPIRRIGEAFVPRLVTAIEETKEKGIFEATKKFFDPRDIARVKEERVIKREQELLGEGKTPQEARSLAFTEELISMAAGATDAGAGKIAKELKGIAKELQPLAIEARKYKSAEEFVKNVFREIPPLEGITSPSVKSLIEVKFKGGGGGSFSVVDATEDIIIGMRPGTTNRVRIRHDEVVRIIKGGVSKPRALLRDTEVARVITKQFEDKLQRFGFDSLTDFYNQAVRGVKEVVPRVVDETLEPLAQGKIALENIQTKPELFQQTRSLENLREGGFEKFKVGEILKDFDETKLLKNPISVGIFDDGLVVTSGHNRFEILKRAKAEGRLTNPDDAYIRLTDYRGPGGIERAVQESIQTNIASKSVKDINLLDLFIRDTINEKELKNALAFDEKKIRFFQEIADTFKNNNLVSFWTNSVGRKLSMLKDLDFGVMQERLNFVNRIAKKTAEAIQKLSPEQSVALQEQIGVKIGEFMEISKVATLRSVENNINRVLETIKTQGFKSKEVQNLFGEVVIQTEVQARSGVGVLRKQVESILKSPVTTGTQRKRLTDFLKEVDAGDKDFLDYINDNVGLTASSEKTQQFLKKIAGRDFVPEKEIESYLVEQARRNYKQNKEIYLKKTSTEDSILLNTDEWRPITHKRYTGLNASRNQEASSFSNNKLFTEVLVSQKGKGNNKVLIYGGGGGSGKGTAIKDIGLVETDYPIRLDQVSDDINKLLGKAELAIQHGYDIEYVFIDRHPVNSFVEGVATRAVSLRKAGKVPRVVHIDINIPQNLKAREVAILAVEKFRSKLNPKIVNNNGMKGDASIVDNPLDFLKSKVYNEDVVRNQVYDQIKRLHESREIPSDIAEGLIGGRPKVERQLQLQPAIRDEGVRGAIQRETKVDISRAPGEEKVTPRAVESISPFRERGFITSAKEAVPELKIAGQYIPRDTDKLAIKAKNLIKDNIAEAERRVFEDTNDEAVATASELIKHYNDLATSAKTQAEKNVFYDKAGAIAIEIAPKLTEQGQAIQAASILGRQTPEGQLRFAARTIQKYNEEVESAKGGLLGLRKKVPELTGKQTEGILTQMSKVKNMPDGAGKAMAFKKLQDEIADLVPSPWWKKAINLWKAGLLTGMKTTGLNELSNLFHGISEVVKDIPAVAVDSAAALFTGERTTALTLRGFKGGVAEGWEKGIRYMKTGFDERNVGIKLDWKRVNYGKSKVAKGLQKYEEMIFHFLGAQDQPFYYGTKARSLASQAIAQGKNKELKGEELQKFIQNLIENPTDKMLQYAVNDAEMSVFQNRTLLGDVARGIQKIPGGEVVVPFGRTPSAVAIQIINYSPIGIVKTIVENIGKGRFDQRLFAQGIGRGVTGMTAMFVGMSLLKRDMISLDRPTSEREQNQWELEGKKPNSIKTPDGKWRSVLPLGPLGMTLILGAQLQKSLNNNGSLSASLLEAGPATAKSFTEQTFLVGVNQFATALNDPGRYAESVAARTTGSIIPTIVSDVAMTTDPLQRRTFAGTEGFFASLIGRIPGLRKTLEPKIDVFGSPLARTGNALETMIDPTRPTRIKSGELIEELKRLFEAGLSATPTRFADEKTYTDVLNPEQITYLQEKAGLMIEEKLKNLIASNEYKNLDDDGKMRTIKNFTNQARVIARAELVEELTTGLVGDDFSAKMSLLKGSGFMTKQVFDKWQELFR